MIHTPPNRSPAVGPEYLRPTHFFDWRNDLGLTFNDRFPRLIDTGAGKDDAFFLGAFFTHSNRDRDRIANANWLSESE